MATTVRELRIRAITHTLFAPTALPTALRRLGFVQADPIRAPARAQDLILRHRVKGYRAGDLERRFQEIDLEEGMLYAYGFLARPVWQLLYPRTTSPLSRLEEEVLAAVTRLGPVHPRALEAQFGRQRVINAWGGHSQATTRAMEHLQRRGLLRVARREGGIRIYEAAPPAAAGQSPPQRFRRLALVAAGILAPVTERGLLAILSYLRRAVPAFGDPRALLRELVTAGRLERDVVDGVAYLWPATRRQQREEPPVVRFLAPFDPLVWERRRFEQLWGWSYRFEAYTPVARRVRGYYALPLLWGEQIVGWANAAVAKGGGLQTEVGFAGTRPRDRQFTRELEAEVSRLAVFLGVETAGAAVPGPRRRPSPARLPG